MVVAVAAALNKRRPRRVSIQRVPSCFLRIDEHCPMAVFVSGTIPAASVSPKNGRSHHTPPIYISSRMPPSTLHSGTLEFRERQVGEKTAAANWKARTGPGRRFDCVLAQRPLQSRPKLSVSKVGLDFELPEAQALIFRVWQFCDPLGKWCNHGRDT